MWSMIFIVCRSNDAIPLFSIPPCLFVSLFAYFPTSLSKSHHWGMAPTRLLTLLWKGNQMKLNLGEVEDERLLIELLMCFSLGR